MAGFSGHVIIDNGRVSGIDLDPPHRLVVVSFDSAERAQAWRESPEAKTFDTVRQAATVSRAFTVEGNAVVPAMSRPTSNGRGRGVGFDPKPFEEIIKRRDKDLERVQSICKGC